MKLIMKQKPIDDCKTFSEDFVFRTNNFFSIPVSQKALSQYSKNLLAALNLENDIPIFLDTNVLLDYYKISFTERDDIIKFFEKNKSRIFITKQIEKEFLKHRIDHIRSYLNSVDEFTNAYKNIKREIVDIKSGIIKGFEHFTTKNQILVNDYPELSKELLKTCIYFNVPNII
ncbi:PIN-like domain-containing protein [Flavobacterium litorale]|uniref:PIN domain-containing protein n=1 Tax=Flavobacterium litorale TaxID=2856519 RepID=A0ABX8V4L0_9FLAO|nr:PIN domain-containing protein [Flavobacterium litorale]QYJ67730.1 PIN domain-containing protein [Flavobacterium litorale]